MKKAIVSVFLLFLFINTHATHIVGGALSYRYMGTLSNGDIVRYQVTVKLYRDGAVTTNAPFDDIIDVGVYNNKNLYTKLSINLSSQTKLSNCYEEGTYSSMVDLNSNKESLAS